MHKCILEPTLFCPIQKETDCYLVLKMGVDVGLDKDLGDLPPLQSCCNMQGCVPVLKTTQSYIHNAFHPCSVQCNPGEIRITINLWHRWTNMAFVHLLIVHSFSSYWHCWTNLAYIHFFLTDHTVIVHRKLLLLLNKLGLGTLYPDCTVVSHITAGEHTWHMYTLSWLYSCCSYYCRWTNLAYVHFILTIQLLLILLLVNKLGICTLYPHCTVVHITAGEQTWHICTLYPHWLYSYCSYWRCRTNLAYVHFFLTVQLLLILTLLNKLGTCTPFPQ